MKMSVHLDLVLIWQNSLYFCPFFFSPYNFVISCTSTVDYGLRALGHHPGYRKIYG